MKNVLIKIFRDELDIRSPVTETTKLHGDASSRTYYRASMEDGRTFIIMQMPEGNSSASEEITNFKGAHAELPFINIARYLAERGIPVPVVFCYSEANRIMVIEDLGDDLMAGRVSEADESTRLSIYKNAVDLLCLLQKNTIRDEKGSCVALNRSFDATLLNWEFDHFIEYGIGARLGRVMKDPHLKIFNDESRAISAKIEKLPYGFTHRDFQSRNLIFRGDKLYLIDFQDALQGPYAYDLVALTRDSYVKLSDATLEELIRYYSEQSGRAYEEVKRDHAIITVQRKLKDAGRFVYIDKVKGNPNFLKFIPTSLGYVRDALNSLPEHRRLYDVLADYIPEWR